MPDINGIPYVESTDLVSGWPTVSQSVAQEVSDQLASKLAAADQKIIQVVRDTDGTARSTTSTTFVDVTGISVTITPTKNTSAILLIASVLLDNQANQDNLESITRITDSSNNAISGAEQAYFRLLAYTGAAQRIFSGPTVLIGYATPATTSATTYKLQHRSTNAAITSYVRGDFITSQLFAIEVGA